MTAEAAAGGGALRRGLPELLEEAPQRPLAHGAWEGWLTFALLAASQLAFAISIERADWVNEMPSLTAAAALGLVAGSALARVRAPALPLVLASLALGLAAATGMVLHTMRLADPLASGAAARWSELWARMGDWASALVFGGVSADPLPFVLLMAFVAWALPCLSGWAVFRWRNPWLALAPAGVAILTNISYLPGQPSIEFILFLFAAILLFTRLQLLRTVLRWRGRRAALPPLLSFEVLHAGAWIAVALILAAWLAPAGGEMGALSSSWERALRPITDRAERFGVVFLGIDSKRGQLIHHFDRALPLQGRVTLGDEPLYRVTLPPGGGAPHLRSTAFDEYGLFGWRLTDTARDPLPGATIEAARYGDPETRARLRRPVVAEVEAVAPLSERRLLTAGEPLAADVAASAVTGPSPEDIAALRPDERLRAGQRYATVGSVSAADAEILVAAGDDYPAWVTERYLQLPGGLPERVREQAEEIAGGTAIPYVAAFRVERWLRANFAFDLRTPSPPPRRDPVDHFLFGTQRGFFDHHASAMAVMLRTLGVPARVAVGFFAGDRALDEETGEYVLTERDSWAWPEVYFPGLGWVEFNPTPGRDTISRPGPQVFGLGDDEPDALVDTSDELLIETEGLLDTGEEELAATETGGGEEAAAGRDWTAPLLWTLGAALALAAATLLGNLAWAWPYRRLAPATARWARVQRLAGWAGLGGGDDRTPLEAASALGREIEAGEQAERLARAFTRERYGGSAPAALADGEAGRLDRAYRRVRNRLLRETLVRRLGLRRLAR